MTSRRILVAAVVLISIAAIVGAIAQRRTRSGPCTLQVKAAVASRNTPIGRATNWNTDMLSIRNADAADWVDPEIAVEPGGYRQRRDFIRSGEQTTFRLNDFANAAGQHWVSLTMTAVRVHVTASMRGEACSADIPL